MKRILSIVSAVAVMALAVSCGPKETEKAASLSVEPSMLSFEAEGAAAQTVTVTATGGVEWEHEVPEIAKEWLTVSREGNVLTVSVTDNLKGDPRNVMVTVKATNNSEVKDRTIDIAQKANDNPVVYSLEVSPAYLQFVGTEAPTQDVTVTVTGDMTWEATPEAEWITITPADGKFTVSVADNPDGKSREGEITVIPSDSEVAPESVRVVQDGKKEFTLSSEEKIVFPYNTINNSSKQIDITASNVKWEAKVVDENDNEITWVTLGIATTYVNVIGSTNTSPDARKAWLVITTDWEERPEVRIEIEQEGAPDHISTLTESIDISEDINFVRVSITPWQIWDTGEEFTDENSPSYDPSYDPNTTKRSNWEIYLMNDTFTYVSGEGYAGPGWKVKFNLYSPRIEWNTESVFYIPTEKPYTIVEAVAPAVAPEEYTLDKGSEQTSFFNKYPGAYVVEYDNDNQVLNKAPLVEGTVTVTHNGGDNYTFAIDAKDDLGLSVKCNWTGDINLNIVGEMTDDPNA